MIKTDRKTPKPAKKVDLQEQVTAQQEEINKQTQIIEGLMMTMDDIILNGMGGM